MRKVGAWWLTKIALKDGEEVIHSFLANRTQSPNRAIGGKVFITNQRLLFCPHLLDYFTGGRKFEVELSRITDVGIELAGGDLFGGGLRNRLRIIHDRNQDLFVVNNLNYIVKTIENSISNHV